MTACGAKGATENVVAQPTVEAAAFDADSAYHYVARQVEFGPRTPGGAAHAECAQWIIGQLEQWGAKVTVQRTTVSGPDGKPTQVVNILGQFAGTDTKAQPVLLVAHYDTRPWADEDPDVSNHDKPVPGANDGASGVGVLLETARQLSLNKPQIPVDLLFIDFEDSGISDGTEDSTDTWCRGTQAWVAQAMPYGKNNHPWPRFGILLDMVGAADAVFPREYYSAKDAAQPLANIWAVAAQLDMESRFPNAQGGAVIDDHLWLTRAGIPTVDIIENQNPQTGSFHPSWHTVNDDMRVIDKSTLHDVGVLVNTVIRQEK